MLPPGIAFEEVVDVTKGTVYDAPRGRVARTVPPRPRIVHRKKVKKTPKPTKPGDFLLEFGRYIGRRLREVPSGYLLWLAETDFEGRRSPAAEAQNYARLHLGWKVEGSNPDAEYLELVRGF